MAFKLRSSEQKTTPSPFTQKVVDVGEYSANEDGTYSRTVTRENDARRVNKEMAKRKASQQFAYNQLSNNSVSNVGSNTGNIFTGRTTPSGSVSSTGINTSGNRGDVSEKEIYKTIRKYGGAKIEDGVMSPQTTNKRTETISGKKYKKIQELKTKKSAKNKETADIKAKKETAKKARIEEVLKYRAGLKKNKAENITAKEAAQKARIEKTLKYRAERSKKKNNKSK